MSKNLILLLSISILFACSNNEWQGETEITKWRDGKKTAISFTYDDGTINQFTTAIPIMDSLGIPATFFIITGKLRHTGPGKFIGRPVEDIIKETASIPTDASNLFERASAIGYSGYQGAMSFHTDAGGLIDESEDIESAIKMIDEGYRKIRAGELKMREDTTRRYSRTDTVTWEDFRRFAANGHEFGSHTVTHPRLAILDETNILYELQRSKEDIARFLGEEHTFSAECPYGTENERVMEYAYNIYPALRNRMPESYLEELNRSSKLNPLDSEKEYIQWQRGPLTNITMETMKGWVDTCLETDNLWLVLVFHGVDGIGWEARTGAELKEYFGFIKSKEDQAWVATFGDVTKYMRERQNATVNAKWENNQLKVSVTHSLDAGMYNQPLTLKSYVPDDWNEIQLKTDQSEIPIVPMNDEKGTYVLYNAIPGLNYDLLKLD
ncbi:MAG: polysaccharide deacetylase family protein [Bacteroidetes bacterium]|nr:polysaccharide deacetylase family protein [Bacteroidota bacterium]MDA1119966.1 polysaccharide deacetylase family protein [Bacteroidota bacterium]